MEHEGRVCSYKQYNRRDSRKCPVFDCISVRILAVILSVVCMTLSLEGVLETCYTGSLCASRSVIV